MGIRFILNPSRESSPEPQVSNNPDVPEAQTNNNIDVPVQHIGTTHSEWVISRLEHRQNNPNRFICNEKFLSYPSDPTPQKTRKVMYHIKDMNYDRSRHFSTLRLISPIAFIDCGYVGQYLAYHVRLRYEVLNRSLYQTRGMDVNNIR